jgi:antitoxin MazE
MKVKEKKAGTKKVSASKPKATPQSKPLPYRIIKGDGLEEEQVLYSVTSRIRRIGNSRGVILSNRLIEEAGFSSDAELVLKAGEGVIVISEATTPVKAAGLSSWDEMFRIAKKGGLKPEGDLFQGISNSFDKEEWT